MPTKLFQGILSFTAILAMILSQGCETHGDKVADFGSNDVNVVSCLGDSMVEMGDPPWPALLSGLTGKTVINRGAGGTTSSYGAGAIDTVLAQDKPAYLIIQFGANDAIHRRDPAATQADLRTIVQAAKANQTVPIVTTILPMYNMHAGDAPLAQEMNILIRSMAKEEGAELADLESAFGGDRSLIEEHGLHPVQDGNEVIASILAGYVH